ANGVIIKSHDPSVVANLAKNTSVVVLDSATRSQNVDAVIPDVDRAVRNQMDYLMELGHRRIANFRQRPTPGTAYHHWQDRCFWREYEDYAADLGLLIPESWKAPILITPDNEIEVMEAFLDRILEGDRPTAILTYDLYAGELIHRLAKRGLSVPGDISIVGFDDATHGRFCPIPLTTYRQDFDAMANEAVTLVRERIKNPARSPRIVKIDGKMIIRDSVAPARP
ncbi:MAG: LacI family DNA-binding transcriptional regulator, partial [Verrucomicrobiota bacterium]